MDLVSTGSVLAKEKDITFFLNKELYILKDEPQIEPEEKEEFKQINFIDDFKL